MRQIVQSYLACIAALLLQGCQGETPLFLVAGSTARNLSLGFGSPAQPISASVQEVAVYPCRLVGPGGAGATWPIDWASTWLVRGQNAVSQSVLKYGEPPPNLKTAHGAEPLESPGCYIVRILATRNGYQEWSVLGITISETGISAEMPMPQLAALLAGTRV